MAKKKKTIAKAVAAYPDRMAKLLKAGAYPPALGKLIASKLAKLGK